MGFAQEDLLLYNGNPKPEKKDERTSSSMSKTILTIPLMFV